jgi:quercetin dioxygenase-like cupin family protein
MAQNAIANSSSSILIGKVQGNIRRFGPVLFGPRRLVFRYGRGKVVADDILAAVHAAGLHVIDLTTGRDFVLPGYKRIRMVDFVFQPGVERKDERMPTAMVCLCTEGEMRIDHRHGPEHAFHVRKGDVWTCVKDQPEDVKNVGSTAAIMRVITFWPT